MRSNSEAEECVVGTCLRSRDMADRLVSELTASDFTVPALARAFAAITVLRDQGAAVDPVTVHDQLRLLYPDKIEDGPSVNQLRNLEDSIPSISSGPRYAQIVRRESSARKEMGVLFEARNKLDEGGDPMEIADSILDQLQSLDRAGHLPERYWRDIDSYLDADHREVGVPLIPGPFLYRRTRCVVYAGAKAGKSMMLRQVAGLASQGVHPFRLTAIDPVPTLILDAENDDNELVPTLKRIREGAKRQLDYLQAHGETTTEYEASRLSLFSLPYGMNILNRRDRGELEEVLERVRPQLIVGGPVYKLIPEDDRGDRDLQTSRLQSYLDTLRRRYDCAIMLEHHTRTDGASAKGGQKWEAWPDLGIRLRNKPGGEAEVVYPHPPRGHFDWPRSLVKGAPGDLPWTARYEGRAQDVPLLTDDDDQGDEPF